ncbi:MAG: hypothetical protein RR645_01455 [Clostridium sp.]
MNRVFKVLDFLTWFMLIVTFVVSILTMIVVFGIAWISNFYTFEILEICLAITLLLWGTTSIKLHDKKAKFHGICSFLFAGVFIIFLMFKVY